MAEGAIHIFKKMTETVFKSTYKVSSQRHFEVLEAQWHGLKVNFRIIVSPRKTFESLQLNQETLGESASKWKWGTAYAGGPRTFFKKSCFPIALMANGPIKFRIQAKN